MPLRILHSIHTVNPVIGGPIEGVRQLSAVNRRDGHSVEIVCLDRPDDPWVRECPVACHAMGPTWLNYGYTPRLVSWLKEHRSEYDVVVVNGIWQYSAFGVWRALRRSATPYFVFTHGMLDPWFKRTYPLKHAKKWLYWPWADYRVLRDAAAVLFTSEEERRLARQSFWLYHCREEVVDYGTAGPAGDAAGQKALFLRTFPHLAARRCLLFLGRVHVKKGPDMLLRQTAALLAGLPAGLTRDLHLVMAGPNDHAYGRRMRSLAAELGLAGRVTWTGMLSGDLKWGAFHSADAFVLPSHQENFGVAVVEALACGVPVLVSDKVNIWPDVLGLGIGLVESDDDAGTRRLLERWVRMPETARTQLRSRTRRSFEERFHVDRTAGQFIRLLQPRIPGGS